MLKKIITFFTKSVLWLLLLALTLALVTLLLTATTELELNIDSYVFNSYSDNVQNLINDSFSFFNKVKRTHMIYMNLVKNAVTVNYNRVFLKKKLVSLQFNFERSDDELLVKKITTVIEKSRSEVYVGLECLFSLMVFNMLFLKNVRNILFEDQKKLKIELNYYKTEMKAKAVNLSSKKVLAQYDTPQLKTPESLDDVLQNNEKGYYSNQILKSKKNLRAHTCEFKNNYLKEKTHYDQLIYFQEITNLFLQVFIAIFAVLAVAYFCRSFFTLRRSLKLKKFNVRKAKY